jgi:hypothetical protein
MDKAGLCGQELSFEADDFKRALNRSALSYVTVRSLPSGADGTLYLGNTAVREGQSISAANLSLLSFAAASDRVETASFTFTVDETAYPITCSLHLLRALNNCPTLEQAPETALAVSTHEDIACTGRLYGHDPEGDALRYEVISYPSHGYLKMEDASTGRYVYTPDASYTGTDSFRYYVRDCFGNSSAAQTVSLTVTRRATSVQYADMAGRETYNAALTMTEQGIMSGVQVGNSVYFYPEQTVSRAEFLVMAMNAVGITDVADQTTVFYDNAQIPVSMRGYVATGYALGYLRGGQDANGNLCFFPSEPITRAEAAVMVTNIIGLQEDQTVPVFADEEDLPGWAQAAMTSLGGQGILTPAEDGSSDYAEVMTREDTAQLLARLMQVVK